MKLLHALTLIALLFTPLVARADQSPVVTVLNTATAENGPLETLKYSFLNSDKPVRMVADVSTGDTVKIQGRATASDSWIDIYSFTADEWKDIWLPQFWRAIRSTNGGGGNATVKVINYYDLNLVAH